MLQIEKINCTGCEACANICPTNAICMETDKEGFWYPKILFDKCISCGACERVCPNLHEVKKQESANPQVYAAWSLNEEVRLNSTSGGIFSELAGVILKQGGYVCGAVYNEEHLVEHFITNTQEGLERIRQSKYVQSRIGNIYQQIEQLLKDEAKILFCGTPCQCTALKNYLEMKNVSTENLWIADFICRGSNSPKVYRGFLDDLESTYHSKVKKVWFKNKTYGWNRFSTKIEFENGEAYLEDRTHDLYIKGYIEKDLYMRPSCTTCKHKGFPRVSDITLADFWGIELNDRTKDSDKGTSMVLLHSDKGMALFNDIKEHVFYEEKTLQEASRGNVCMYHSVPFGKNRADFMKEIDTLHMIENMKRFM